MAEFMAVSPNAEVLGHAVLSIMNEMGMARTRAMKILAQNGIRPLEPDQWYPQQGVLNAFRTIFERIEPTRLHTLGRKLPENAPFPPSITCLAEALRSMDVAYRASHRGMGHGLAYTFEPLSERSARLICETPYPCEMDLGLVEGLAERFRPKDSPRVQVTHEPGECRRDKAERCIYSVHW